MFSKYRLPGQLENEEVIKIVRKDIFVLLKKIFIFALLIILPYVFYYITKESIFPTILQGQVSYPLLILGASFYFLFIWLFFFFSFIDYYLDIWVITNERIIDIRQEGFFSRTISEQRLFRVQDVTSEVHGFLQTIFRFGDVHIQTAATKQRFFFDDVSHPDEIRDLIIGQIERSKLKHQDEAKKENT